MKGRTHCRELLLCVGSGLGKGVSGKPYPRLCNARRPRLKPGTFQSQAVRLYRLHQARPSLIQIVKISAKLTSTLQSLKALTEHPKGRCTTIQYTSPFDYITKMMSHIWWQLWNIFPLLYQLYLLRVSFIGTKDQIVCVHSKRTFVLPLLVTKA